MSRVALLAACLLAVLPCAACQGGGATRTPGMAAASAPAPMRFRRLRSMLDDAQGDAARGDAARLRGRGPSLSNEGLALIKATMPHDVARTDVPRYLEGRARFGDALKRWVTAVESGSDAQLFQALRDLDDATRGWVDAYLGREPETSI